eukprot:146081_1
MLATLWPMLKVIYEACHLDVLWHKLISIATWVLKVIDPLISLLTFSIPLLVADQALHFPANSGARSQICILAGGLAIMAFFYRTSKAPTDFVGRGYFEAVSFSWGFSCLVPLALIGASRFLGFFAVGCVFGAMGFVAFPMPSGWAAGFQDEASMDKCMYTSLVIISFSVTEKVYQFIPQSVMETFQTGLSVFGMLAFGLAGLIKSSIDCKDNWISFGDKASLMTVIYPVSWIVIGLIGSLVSYPSLTNTAITFVCLWITQFYWRLAGLTSVSVFIFSCILFYVTLLLKANSTFLRSVFQ